MGELPRECDNLEQILMDTIENPTLPNWDRLRDELKSARTYMTEKQLQHYYNSGHVYGRLIRGFGYSKEEALRLSKMYDINCRPVIYRER